MPSPRKNTYADSVPAVAQACRILIYLARHPSTPMKLTTICTEVGIHNSKGYSILNTLGSFGLVQRDPIAKTPYLQTLSYQTGETSLFGLLSAEQVFIIAKQEGSHLIGVNISLGHRFHMTAGAHGKAIVSALPDAERRKVLYRKNLYFYGDPKRFDHKRLEAEIKKARVSGFAEDRGELQPGINAVSAAVLDREGSVLGCVILIGTYPEDKLKEFGPLVSKTAQSISTDLGFSRPWIKEAGS
ncbi:MAG: IclR family transcriptional regulator [Deltaproteobacteria bacterium]|nr:IclR family transcriptional regulator [Deltaproteobacteria bacterium]